MTTTAYRACRVDPSVFRAYDIRGVVGSALDEHAYYTLGLALAVRMKSLSREKVHVARDGRVTSKMLEDALIAGLTESGVDVEDLGAVPTPLLYYATHTGFADSGLMVTGSHNPAEYNGLKMVLAGKAQSGPEIAALHDTVNAGTRLYGSGKLSVRDIVGDYQSRIVSDITLRRPLKVVVDAGNGIAGLIAPGLFKALGCDVIPLHCEVDGRFPNHHPDPAVEDNLEDLRDMVLQSGADLGLAFDGDGDRLGVVDETGRILWPDRLLMCYAREILARKPGGTIVYDVKCSAHLEQVIRTSGGTPVMCATGHSLVKGVMRKEKALLAGEMSGHLFFGDRWYGFDDALYSACRLLEIVSGSTELASQQFARIPDSINTPELRIPMQDERKFDCMQRFVSEACFPGARMVTIDGLRVEFEKGWGLLRASNTTPCLIARFEADTPEMLETIKIRFREELLKKEPGLQIPF